MRTLNTAPYRSSDYCAILSDVCPIISLFIYSTAVGPPLHAAFARGRWPNPKNFVWSGQVPREREVKRNTMGDAKVCKGERGEDARRWSGV